MFGMLKWAAAAAPSQLSPSWMSPSDISVKTWEVSDSPSRRSARQIPTDIESPWPSEPVETSTPGVRCMSGWPWRWEPILRSPIRSWCGK